MAEGGVGASNLNQSSLNQNKPRQPDRTKLVHELGKLRQELRAARAMDSPNREAIVRQKIDRRLEDLYSCVDPAGVASEAEYGRMGVEPT